MALFIGSVNGLSSEMEIECGLLPVEDEERSVCGDLFAVDCDRQHSFRVTRAQPVLELELVAYFAIFEALFNVGVFATGIQVPIPLGGVS